MPRMYPQAHSSALAACSPVCSGMGPRPAMARIFRITRTPAWSAEGVNSCSSRAAANVGCSSRISVMTENPLYVAAPYAYRFAQPGQKRLVQFTAHAALDFQHHLRPAAGRDQVLRAPGAVISQEKPRGRPVSVVVPAVGQFVRPC